MSEYIKKEDAMQLFLNHMGVEFPQSIKEQIVEKAFEELPLSADVLEVVRCKYCKHRIDYSDGDGWYCDVTNNCLMTDENFYCSYGERKGNEQN